MSVVAGGLQEEEATTNRVRNAGFAFIVRA